MGNKVLYLYHKLSIERILNCYFNLFFSATSNCFLQEGIFTFITYTARPVCWREWISDSYCSLKPLCLGMGKVVPARTSLTLLPPSPRTVLSTSCFQVSQCINCRDWHCKSYCNGPHYYIMTLMQKISTNNKNTFSSQFQRFYH